MKNSKIIAAKRIAVAVAAVCATMSAPAFAANDTKNLLDLLLKKGVITQAEYETYLKSDEYENQQFKEKRTDDDLAKAAKYIQKHEKDGSVTENGVGLQSADGQHRINLEGRIHFDYRNFNSAFANDIQNDKDTAKFGNNFEVRRARIGLNGYVFKDIGFKILTNTLGSDSNLIDEAWLNFGYVKEAQVRIGRFKQQNNLEELTSSNNIDFMERSYVNQFAPGKKLGVMLHGVPTTGLVYGVSMYQNAFAQTTSNGNSERSARLALNAAELMSINDQVMHLGVSSTSGDFDVTASSNIAALATIRSEDRGMEAYRANIAVSTDKNLLVTKEIQGLELAYAYGPFKLQSEYSEVKLSGKDMNNNNGTVEGSGKIKNNYVAALYNITGESWSGAYKDGTFGALKPASNFKPGAGTGLWQVGVRVSEYDASDIVLTGASAASFGSPKGKTITYGLTWFINPNARVMLNHSMTKLGTAFTPSYMTGGDSERVTTLRMQYNF